MKKLVYLLLICTLLIGCFSFSVVSAEESTDIENYEVEVSDEHNLALNAYDWNNGDVSGLRQRFHENGFSIDKNTGNSFFEYITHKYNSFTLDMYANVYQPWYPAEGDLPNRAGGLCTAFFIDIDKIDAEYLENRPYPCTDASLWSANGGYFGIWFEHDMTTGEPTVTFLVNGFNVWPSVPDAFWIAKKVVSPVEWADGNFHWFKFDVRSTKDEDPTVAGTTVKLYIDGKLIAEFFQSDLVVCVKDTTKSKNFELSTLKGYMAFGVTNYNQYTSTDDNYFEVAKYQVTCYDTGEPEIFEVCEPEGGYEVNAVESFAPDTFFKGQEGTIDLNTIFSYAGKDGKLTFEALDEFETPIGEVTEDGIFKWTPKRDGKQQVTFKATSPKGKFATVSTRIRIEKPEAPAPKPVDPEPSKGGCGSSVTVGAIVTVVALAGAAMFIKKKEN